MSRLPFALILIAALTLAACRAADRAQTIQPDVTESAGGEGGEVDEEALLGALLTLDDMPTGWTQTEAPSWTAAEPGSTRPVLCREAPGRAVGSAGVDFSLSDLGPNVSHLVVAYPSEDEATADFADFVAAAQACGEYSDDNGNVYTLDPLSFPELGDEAFAVRSSGGLVQADVVRVRVGQVVIILINAGVSIDSDLTEQLARLAVERAARR